MPEPTDRKPPGCGAKEDLKASGLAVVDELAHSNVPGSRNPKRYLDVKELLAAGIDVFTSMNVQHIESLADQVAGLIWTVVRETVPDRLIDMAEEIEVVDLSPADLVDRLKSGKVDVLARPEQAIKNYFSERNLTALRELALRQARRAPARRILVPFDGSPSACRAVDHVVSLSRAGHQPDVLLLNVQPLPAKSAASDAVSGPDSRAAGHAILDKASRILEAQHIPHRCEVVVGRPPEEIIAAADEHRINLIVMGSRGIGAVARLFLGSVAMAVVHESKRPVTLVK